jgi:hypothetical protein
MAAHYGFGTSVVVVWVFWTFDEPSGCSVVVSFVSTLVLFPVSVVVLVLVLVVVVDFGGVLPPHALNASEATRTSDVDISSGR